MENPIQDVPKQAKKQREPKAPKAPRAEQAADSPNKPTDSKHTNGDKSSPKQKAPRRERNDDWKIELEKTMTVDTKIPPMPKDEDLLKKPDPASFNAALEKIAKKIEKNFNEMEELKKQERDLRDALNAKNNSEFVELKKLGEQRRELAEKMGANKKAKEDLKAQIDLLEDKKSKVAKKGFSGKVLPKEKLEELIAEREKEYKNMLKTSADEKRFLEEISKLRESMPLATEMNKIQVQIDALYKRNKEISTSNKEFAAQMDAIRSKSDAIRAKLGLADRKEEEKKEEGDKKEKPKKELTPEEKEFQAKRQALFDQITKLKDQRTELRNRHQKENDDFYKQQEEIYKIKFMTGLLKKLKIEEQKKQYEANKEKRQQEELDRAKEKAAAKYKEDIEICSSLLSEMEQIRFREKMTAEKVAAPTESKAEYKINDASLKEANLVMIKPKKDQDEGVQPGQKKFAKKGKKQEEKKTVDTEPAKLDITMATLQNLAKLGVVAPTNLEQIDNVVEAIKSKKDALVKQRDDAMSAAKVDSEDAAQQQASGEEETLKETKEEPVKEKKQPAKEIKFDEASFPALE